MRIRQTRITRSYLHRVTPSFQRRCMLAGPRVTIRVRRPRLPLWLACPVRFSLRHCIIQPFSVGFQEMKTNHPHLSDQAH
jgi:hypothetical protein